MDDEKRTVVVIGCKEKNRSYIMDALKTLGLTDVVFKDVFEEKIFEEREFLDPSKLLKVLSETLDAKELELKNSEIISLKKPYNKPILNNKFEKNYNGFSKHKLNRKTQNR